MIENQIEQSVTDAITQKPIRFSVGRFKNVQKEVEVIRRKRLISWLPFLYKRDKVIERQTESEYCKEEFEIKPPTIGKFEILTKIVLQLNIDYENLDKMPHEEINRICAERTDLICSMMAVATIDGQKDLTDDNAISERAEFFKWHCKVDDLATCLLAVYSIVDYSNFITSMRLTKIFDLNKPTEARAVRVEQSEEGLRGARS